MKYTIVNLVASSSLNQNLDLYNLAMTLPDVEYEPEQFPGAILKIKEPHISLLLFKNGKLICSGASSEKDIEIGIRKAAKLVKSVQKDIKVPKKIEYEIVNLVATASLDLDIDLFSLAVKLDNVEYEPEQFPGAIIRIDDPLLTILLFKNGKMIIAGAKREIYLKKGLKRIVEIVNKLSGKKKSTQKKKKTKSRKSK